MLGDARMIAGQDQDTGDWSPAELELLRRLWDADATAGAISIELAKIGPGRSRSAVIGKTRRLNLVRRPSPIKGVVTKQAEPRATPAPRPKPAPKPAVVRPSMPPLPGARRVSPAAAAMAPRAPHRTCQWITNNGPPWAFCGCPRWDATRMPYCEEHAIKARAKRQDEGEAA